MNPTQPAITTSSHRLEDFGSVVRLIDGVLFERPDYGYRKAHWSDFHDRWMDPQSEWYEVTAVEGMSGSLEQDQAYLDAVNDLFGSDFEFSDFAGR